jgi:UDP-glucose:(heptosyl)LPS alpha-1,3-glucosyltransferase
MNGTGPKDAQLRIALVVHDYHREGGHSRYTAELAERFSAWGHETHVFANRFPEGAAVFPTAAMQDRPLYFHAVPAQRRTALQTVLSFYRPASRMVRQSGPFDIVHGQGYVCAGCNLLTAHICCAAWHAQRLRSGHGLNWKERIFDAVVMRIEKNLFGRAQSPPVIAISQRVREDLREFYGRQGGMTVIPHGVDLREFDRSQAAVWRAEIRQKLHLPEQQFVALWVGDLRKGFQAAMEAIRQNPGQLLVGVSRSETESFRALARQWGIAERVLLLGPTKEIAKFYAAADVLLFPTTYDAFGMVVLEAMAMGLPVIVSRDAGAADLLVHETNGILLQNPFDAGESAPWLRRLEEDKEFRERLQGAGRQTAEAQDWDKVAQQTLAVYQNIAAAQREKVRA